MDYNFKPDVFTRLGKIINGDVLYTKDTGDRESHKKFITKFPAEEIENLTLDQYCMGRDAQQGNFAGGWNEAWKKR
ncbi:hypothetical protein P3339_13960 [Microbulbifer sp. MLAF003]|uniref:hypothetical protein n=1 Tax=Microbulbifer sp. MLAF003 TaxID=3032582 RepID=UPI0024ACBD85|nr:hypothetical protein [Microbulbifer sp. MLAF003]WHI49575.1 hypothetical protein P3339_13960 [Microbulbifer sp. MLAF003]